MSIKKLVSLLPILLIFISGCSSSRLVSTDHKSEQQSGSERSIRNDAGIWPLPGIRDSVYSAMRAKGLRLTPEEIYHPSDAALNRAVVRVNIPSGGGGTASFVSGKGLLLTNHHGIDESLPLSGPDGSNLLREGFHAKNLDEEIPLEGYNLYILLEQEEVTDTIRALLPDSLRGERRRWKVREIKNRLVAERRGGNRDIAVEIDDFWSGNKQFLSVYRIIRDVRLSYAPPYSIAKFGGSKAVLQWPQYTGDFAFLRAYVGPEGHSRSYDPENIPYRPDRHLSINTRRLKEGDFTLVPGFPAATFRHESSYAFRFYEKVRNPILRSSFSALLDAAEYRSRQSPESFWETAPDRFDYTLGLKYYEGVQQGFAQYDITEKKRKQEETFRKWVEADSSRNERYGRVLSQLRQAYTIASQTGDLLYALAYPLNYNRLMQIAALYEPYYVYLIEPGKHRFSDDQRRTVVSQHRAILESMNVEAQNHMLADMLTTLAGLPDGKILFYFEKYFFDVPRDSIHTAVSNFLDRQKSASLLFDPEKGESFLNEDPAKAASRPTDKLVELYQEMREAAQFARQNYDLHSRYLLPAQKLYEEGMNLFHRDPTAYPDANFTLRLSAGRIKGYRLDDGTSYAPFARLDEMPAPEAADITGKLHSFHKEGTLAVNFLSTNDVSPGSSGSPVLNAEGELTGLVFNANIEGVASDYYFVSPVKRTISVDIRYILFLMREYSSAMNLIDELGVTTE